MQFRCTRVSKSNINVLAFYFILYILIYYYDDYIFSLMVNNNSTAAAKNGFQHNFKLINYKKNSRA